MGAVYMGELRFDRRASFDSERTVPQDVPQIPRFLPLAPARRIFEPKQNPLI
jgi:hypothetical protein